MKALTLFMCEYCNTQYKSKEMASQCEEHHKKIKGVVGAKYRSLNSDKSGIPDYVTVQFEDGTEIRYQRS